VLELDGREKEENREQTIGDPMPDTQMQADRW